MVCVSMRMLFLNPMVLRVKNDIMKASVKYLFPSSLELVLPLGQQALAGAEDATGALRRRRRKLRQVGRGRTGRRDRS